MDRCSLTPGFVDKANSGIGLWRLTFETRLYCLSCLIKWFHSFVHNQLISASENYIEIQLN